MFSRVQFNTQGVASAATPYFYPAKKSAAGSRPAASCPTRRGRSRATRPLGHGRNHAVFGRFAIAHAEFARSAIEFARLRAVFARSIDVRAHLDARFARGVAAFARLANTFARFANRFAGCAVPFTHSAICFAYGAAKCANGEDKFAGGFDALIRGSEAFPRAKSRLMRAADTLLRSAGRMIRMALAMAPLSSSYGPMLRSLLWLGCWRDDLRVVRFGGAKAFADRAEPVPPQCLGLAPRIFTPPAISIRLPRAVALMVSRDGERGLAHVFAQLRRPAGG